MFQHMFRITCVRIPAHELGSEIVRRTLAADPPCHGEDLGQRDRPTRARSRPFIIVFYPDMEIMCFCEWDR